MKIVSKRMKNVKGNVEFRRSKILARVSNAVTTPNVLKGGVSVSPASREIQITSADRTKLTQGVLAFNVAIMPVVKTVIVFVNRAILVTPTVNVVLTIAVEELSVVRMPNVLMVDANVSLVTKVIHKENAVQEKIAEDSSVDRMLIAEMKFASVKRVTRAILILDVNG